jgi:diguanylate cyclase (GGDEF)-like protein
MLVIDIDHFKRINDNHGHLAGDSMLKHIAETIGEQKRAEDVLGRIGGEEFVLLMVDPEHRPDERGRAVAPTRRDIELFYGGNTLTAAVSGGLAIYPADGK